MELRQGAQDLGNSRRALPPSVSSVPSVPSVMESNAISGSYRYVPNFINEEEEAYLLRKVEPIYNNEFYPSRY